MTFGDTITSPISWQLSVTTRTSRWPKGELTDAKADCGFVFEADWLQEENRPVFFYGIGTLVLGIRLGWLVSSGIIAGVGRPS